MSGATQLPLRPEPRGFTYGELRPGMSFRDPATGHGYMVLTVAPAGSLGPIDRLAVTYLVTTPGGDGSRQMRVEGWVRGTAWHVEDRVDGMEW